MSYKLKLDLFEGPLDLLLYLIKKDDIDVSDIPIAHITEQYMSYIEMMQVLDLEMVGDFLVMAATLMQIKSRMLLPPVVVEQEEEEDPRDELVRRLNEYKKFKELAEVLKEKEEVRRDFLSRLVDEENRKLMIDDARETFFEANLFDLITAFSDALQKVPEEVIHNIVKEEFTVSGKIHDILHLMVDEKRVKLTDLFTRAKSKIEMIVTFLAVLELIRLKEIKAVQKRAFADIEVEKNEENIVTQPES